MTQSCFPSFRYGIAGRTAIPLSAHSQVHLQPKSGNITRSSPRTAAPIPPLSLLCLWTGWSIVRLRLILSTFNFQLCAWELMKNIKFLHFVFWQIRLSWTDLVSFDVSTMNTCALDAPLSHTTLFNIIRDRRKWNSLPSEGAILVSVTVSIWA